MQRAWDVTNVTNKQFTGMPFEGRWAEVIGKPERAHNWLIWGQSGSGKTTFNMQLAKYLSSFETVLYNSLEEGLSKSMQMTYQRVGILPGDKILLVQESMSDLNKRLMRRRAPQIVIIDSVKYTKFRWKEFEAFSERYPDVLKIWIAHADGKEPRGQIAKDMRYDAHVKIYTEGYRAFITSRFNDGGEAYLDIWPEKAAQYWAEKAS